MVYVPPLNDGPVTHRRRFFVWSALALSAAAVMILFVNTRPLRPAFDWINLPPPPGRVNFDSIVALDDGVAMLSGVTAEGTHLWWRDTSGSWESHRLDGAPNQLTGANHSLITYRTRHASRLISEEGAWIPHVEVTLPAPIRFRQASGRPALVGTDDGLLELSLFGDVWRVPFSGEPRLVIEDPEWGPGVEQPFASACRPPARSSPDVPPIVATDDGLLALTSSNQNEPFGIWPVCEPVSWTSPDGVSWSSATTNLGADGAYVYDLASRHDTVLAVGGSGIGKPSVWASQDGLEWVDITPGVPDAVDLYRVVAGDLGWVILGTDSLESEPVGWTSTDTACWEPLPTPVMGSDAAVTDHEILILDRTVPTMWIGLPTGSAGACR